MTDQELLEQFEQGSLPQAQFRHRNHLRVAWIYLSQNSFEAARSKLTGTILRYATQHGAAHIYNETLTCFWLAQVDQCRQQPELDFDDFIAKNAFLLDKNLPLRYYSQERLESERARREWLEPDLPALK